MKGKDYRGDIEEQRESEELEEESLDSKESLESEESEDSDSEDTQKPEPSTSSGTQAPVSTLPDAIPAFDSLKAISEQEDPYISFTAHHLHLLHSALQTSNLGVSSRIISEIKDQYDIDLGDETTLNTLSAAQYITLKKYEKKNTDFLVASIVNEYPGAIKYLSKIVKQNNVIDPLGTFQKWFGAIVFCIGSAYLFFASYWPIPEANRDIVSMVIGVIIGQLIMTPMNYIFRSRQDSSTNSIFPTTFTKKK